jgi:hypothetical protein
LGVKFGTRKYLGQTYKLGYDIENFKTWVMLQKLKLGDILLRDKLAKDAEKQKLKEAAKTGTKDAAQKPETKVSDPNDKSSGVNAKAVVLIQEIIESLRMFEKQVLYKTEIWQVVYQWIKSLGEILMLDMILFDAEILKYILAKASLQKEKDINFKNLEKLGWITQISDDIYI